MQQRTARRLAQNGFVHAAARAGYAAKGVVYVLIGGIAVTAATGRRMHLGGGETAVRTIGDQPYGQILLVLAGLGLFGYAFWRALQVIFDPEHKSVFLRAAYAVSGALHAMLGVLAFQLALGTGTDGHSERSIVSSLLRVEGGAWIVFAMGAAIVAYAFEQTYVAWTTDFMRELRVERMSSTERRAAFWIGRIGLVARAVVFAIIGVGVMKAAIDFAPGEAKGVGGALSELASQPYGVTLLLIVALGLCAYGVFQFALARYRRIPSAP